MLRHLSIVLLIVALLSVVGCGDDGREEPVDAAEDAGPDASDAVEDEAGDATSEDAAPDTGDTAAPDPGALWLLAGEAATGFTDGPATRARFNQPAGLALGAGGYHIADTLNGLLRWYDPQTGEVTRMLGAPDERVTRDGDAATARFRAPRALALSADGGVLYVADGPTIRQVRLDTLEVETLAGLADTPGHVDGVGAQARLGISIPSLVLSEDGETLYIADRGNRVIRALKLATRGVYTVAGSVYEGNTPQSVDGPAAQARFGSPAGLARVGALLYIADTSNHTVRKLDLGRGVVRTLIGVAGEPGSVDGPGHEARLASPLGLGVGEGRLLITTHAGLLRSYSLTAATLETLAGVAGETLARDGEAADARLGPPLGDPVVLEDGVVLLDRSANSLRRVDLITGAVVTVCGPVAPAGTRDGALAQARFQDLLAIVGADGQLYVADTFNHTVRHVDPQAQVVRTLAGQPGEAGSRDGVQARATLAWPSGLALDAVAGQLYIADAGNHAVRRVDLASGVVVTIAGATHTAGAEDGAGVEARFNEPWHLALSAREGALYVADTGNHALRRVDLATRQVTTVAGLAGAPGDRDGRGVEARLRSPAGLALDDAAGLLYITDSEGHTLRQLRLSTGQVTTLGGRAGVSGHLDGSLDEALFNAPRGLALLDAGATLLVSDVWNHAVRRVDLATRQVSTLVGDPALGGALPPDLTLPLDAATLYAPEDVAVIGDDVLVLSEAAIYRLRLPAPLTPEPRP